MRILAITGKTLLILMACMSFMGCASFSRHNLPEVGEFPQLSPEAKKPTATVGFSSEMDLFGKQAHPENARAALEAEFVEILRGSGYFATVEKGTGGKDLALTVHLVDSGSPAAMVPAMLTGLSLYVIPSWATDRYEILCKEKAHDGKQHEYKLEDSATLVQWLPMVLAFPFNMPTKVPVGLRKNMYKNVILKMQEDGVLPKADAPLKTSSLMIRVEFESAA